jgi:cytochrome d ubiquinol oxidase subunit I
VNKPVVGIKDLVAQNEARIRNGMSAYAALEKLRSDPGDPTARSTFRAAERDLGYALLLKRYTPAVVDATDEQIKAAALDTIPPVAPLFWAFRLMVAIGFWLLLVFGLAFLASARRRVGRSRLLLWMAVLTIPMPWLAAELGWFVAEVGRQPWTVSGVLPTWLSVSSLTVTDLVVSLIGFVLLYTVLLVVEMYLMVRSIREGPDREDGGDSGGAERSGLPVASAGISASPVGGAQAAR